MALGFLKRLQRKRQRRQRIAHSRADDTEHKDDRCALLVVAHPALHRSRANAALLEAARAHREITFHDLYEAYADFLIDVEAEQKKLVDHRLIILQFPLYWYSTPALLKEWLDMVLLHGFAFGRHGTKLRGKTLLIAVTAGGDADAYHPQGVNRFSMTEFLRPLEATAHLCGLIWAEPFILHDSIQMDDEGRRAAADAYAARLAEVIGQVRP